MSTEILSQFELRRYEWQINLPDVGLAGQEKLKKARVLVIGAGGKGTSVLQHLISAGVGNIGISDNNIIDVEDLTKQHLYGNTDLGKQKAIISKEKLFQINSYTQIELHNICLTERNIENICRGYDVFVDATDINSSHYVINDCAVNLKIPVIYGRTNPPVIEVSVFNYNDGPSYRCLYPEKEKTKKQVPLDGIISNSILCSITGTIMANETLKVILGLSNTLSGKLFQLNINDYSTRFEQIKRNSANFVTH